jgi:DNA-binding GntR family transcriptional regulator
MARAQPRKTMPKGGSQVRFRQIYEALREAITLLRHPPGVTLSEAELAREFGTSRTPIRRVLQALEADGLVQSKQGVGTIVTTADLKSLRDVFAIRMKLAEALGELSPVADLEPLRRELAALVARADKLATTRDLEEFMRINNALQSLLSRLSTNAEFQRITEQLYYKTVRSYFRIVAELGWPGEVRALLEELSAIADALGAEDLKAVGFVRRNFISTIHARMTRYLMAGEPAA